jgi:four helix bundle protein
MAFAFKKLLVYQNAMDFSDQVCELTLTFPRGFYFLFDQLNRAALSVAANIAEGNGRFTLRDRKNFFGIAGGSVQECVPLLELAKRRGLIRSEQHLKFKADLEEIAKMISGLINALETRKARIISWAILQALGFLFLWACIRQASGTTLDLNFTQCLKSIW